jgi:hypothetical protein
MPRPAASHAELWDVDTFAAMARQHGLRCLARLVEIIEGDDSVAAVAAATTLLAYAYGAPQQLHVIQPEMDERQATLAAVQAAALAQLSRSPSV